MGEHVVNITPSASGNGLRDSLEEAARARGKPIRSFVGAIYAYAVKNRAKFSGQLKSPRRKPGQHIGATVSETVSKELTRWAKAEDTSRGMWCCFILEKALADDMLGKIFDKAREQ